MLYTTDFSVIIENDVAIPIATESITITQVLIYS